LRVAHVVAIADIEVDDICNSIRVRIDNLEVNRFSTVVINDLCIDAECISRIIRLGGERQIVRSVTDIAGLGCRSRGISLEVNIDSVDGNSTAVSPDTI